MRVSSVFSDRTAKQPTNHKRYFLVLASIHLSYSGRCTEQLMCQLSRSSTPLFRVHFIPKYMYR